MTKADRDPQPDGEQVPEGEELYRDAPGSGAAAVLAFAHIALSGVLLYGSYFVLRYGNTALLSSRQLWWQFFLPGALALALYLPSDPLTRVLSQVAAGFGALAAAALVAAVAMTAFMPARQIPEFSVGGAVFNVALGVVLSAAVALVVRRIFRIALKGAERR